MFRTPQAALARTLRGAIGIVSGLLLVFYYFVAAALVPWEPTSIGQILLLYPLPYFAYCIVSCLGFLRGRWLVISGVIAHVGLAALIIWLLLSKGALSALLFSGFALLWSWMCVARLAGEAEPAVN